MLIEDFKKDLNSLIDLYKKLNDNFSEQVKILDSWIITRNYSEEELSFLKHLIQIEIEFELKSIDEVMQRTFHQEIEEGVYDEEPPEIPAEILENWQKEIEEKENQISDEDFPEYYVKFLYKGKYFYRENIRYRVFRSQYEEILSYLKDDISNLTFKKKYPESFTKINLRYFKETQKFERAERWLFEKDFINEEGKWSETKARKGEIGAFVRLLVNEKIVSDSKGFKEYFCERYNVESIEDQYRITKAKPLIERFYSKGLRDAIYFPEK